MRKELLLGVCGLVAFASPAQAIERPLAEIARPARAATALPEAPGNVGPGSKITFANSCAAGRRITVVGVGDLLFHPDLEKEALTPTGTYSAFWKPVQSVLANADLTYGNFEGTAAEGITTRLEFVKDPGREWNNSVYTAPPYQLLFNYHPSLTRDLKASGFDVVSTANNHALDRGPIGIERTIANLQKSGVASSGTRMRDAVDTPFSVVTSVKGLNVAWLACTYYTNGFIDQHSQILYCFEQREQVLAEIKRLAASPNIDAVILTPHWGLEGSPTPEQRQRDLAHDAIEAGATAVIGTHPHVLQPWERYTARDGREALIVYSTGNFISGQHRPDQRLGAMVVMELLKEPGAAKLRVSAAGYVSSWVQNEGPHRVTEAPRTMPSRFLPEGNRVYAADLPKLPRDCGTDVQVAASWGDQPPVAVAVLPLPAGTGQIAEAKTGAVIRDAAILPAAAGNQVLVPLLAAGAAVAAQPVIVSTPTLTAIPPSLPRPLILAKPLLGIGSVLVALRDGPKPGVWLAVLAEARRSIASDRAARMPAAAPEASSKDKPAGKRTAFIRAAGATGQLFVAKHN